MAQVRPPILEVHSFLSGIKGMLHPPCTELNLVAQLNEVPTRCCKLILEAKLELQRASWTQIENMLAASWHALILLGQYRMKADAFVT